MPDDLESLQAALAGTYRIGRELGRGGMATVYLAHDLRHGRDVALKLLRPELAASLGPSRFEREIRLTARLDHPHILPLLDSGHVAGMLYYVMPYVEGESLRDRLDRERQLPLEAALRITSEVADALSHAHQLGVIHRDVKPENILLSGGHARLADLGIARTMAVADHESRTMTGIVVGTIAYMSPEQASGDRAIDQRTDVYSLGCVAFEMLSGEPPFAGGSPASLLARKLGGVPPSLRAMRDTAPAEVDRVIRKALATAPDDRFRTASEFAAALAEAWPPAARPSPTAERPRRRRLAPWTVMITLVAVASLGAAVAWVLRRDRDDRWLTREVIPAVEAALDVADWETAYALAREAEARVPGRPELAQVWPRLAWTVTIPSEPAGARVFRQAYDATDDTWEDLGPTPVRDVRIPFGLSRLRLELPGHRPLLRALGGAHVNWSELAPGPPEMLDRLLVPPDTFRLDTDATLPADKVRVPGWRLDLDGASLALADFLLGKYEVTNAEYKVFVDSGGYERPELWDPVVVGGDILPWSRARALFVDRTGRPGPSTWVAGDHPDGAGDLPVAGVSWYEASAYARFVGQELPTAHHWQQALANSMFPWLLPASNFDGRGARRVFESRAMSHVGAFDMTGNVREWTATALGDERIILGGSWHDPYFVAGSDDASAPPMDRSDGNGIRLAVTHDEPGTAARVRAPMRSRRTALLPAARQPVSDEVYAAFGRIFDYPRGAELHASIESADTTALWIRERIRFDAGYDAERMLLYLYLPRGYRAPYQTVVYWPGWDAFWLDDPDAYFAKQLDFVVKRGRAVAFPIYRGSFERRIGNARQLPPFGTPEYRDNVIDGVKDLRRTIDFLGTRRDIDTAALAFLGYSWGGVNGPTAMAQEPRLHAGIVSVGLLPPMAATPEVDPVNALPRVRQPTLVLSGEFDPLVPIDDARRYFGLLGSAAGDKRHVVAVGGHFIPRDLVIREVLEWLDGHLGAPRR